MAEITRDVLMIRLAQMEQREQQAIADANAAHGAIVVLNELLQHLELPADVTAEYAVDA